MPRKVYFLVSLVANCLLTTFVLMRSPTVVTEIKEPCVVYTAPEIQNRPKFDFIPKHPVFPCNDLFTDAPGNTFTMSAKFDRMVKAFHSEVNISVDGKTGPVAGYFEGHSFLLPQQYKALHYLASRKTVRTVCEIGFNYGHSSFNFLTANDDAVVHSFDIGSHKYTKHMADYLSATFPGRFFIHYGDSTKSVPLFIQNNTGVRCDLIFVDGSHTYSAAKSDLVYLTEIASNDNIVVMNHYPTNKELQYGQAWEELVFQEVIVEIMRCRFAKVTYKAGAEAAFVIGSAFIGSK